MEEYMAAGTTIDDLNDDLTVEILSRLPFDSAIQCREVCNRWRYLTKHGPFTLKNTTTIAAVYDHHRGHSYMCLDRDLRSNQQPLGIDFSIDFKDKRLYNYRIIASCNGLLFSLVFFPGFPELDQCYISNPWTKDSLCLPQPTNLCSSSICGLAFENNPSSSSSSQRLVPLIQGQKTTSTSGWNNIASYKIVIAHEEGAVPHSEETYRFEVYSSSTNKWQLLGRTRRVSVETNAVYCNGVLYWQCIFVDLALMFNLNTDTSGYLELPSMDHHDSFNNDHYFSRKHPHRRLAECRGELHYIQISSDCCRLNVWRLSTSSEWLAMHDVDLDHAIERNGGLFPMYRKNFPTVMSIDMSFEGDDDKVLLSNDNFTQIVSYNPKRGLLELVFQTYRRPKWVFFFHYSPTTKLITEM